MTKIVQEAINDQITAELSASYQYLAMSAYCEEQHFPGCARWLRMQSQEEYGHAMKLFDFLLAQGVPVKLQAMEAPSARYASIIEVFEKALEQEEGVSRQIDALYEMAFKEKAYAMTVQLQWFLLEQVEEEKTARDIVAKFHLVRDDPAAWIDLDAELGGRSASE
jgi:ferritin